MKIVGHLSNGVTLYQDEDGMTGTALTLFWLKL